MGDPVPFPQAVLPASMIPRRYAIVIADRTSGVMRRFTLPVRPAIAAGTAVLALCLGWVLHAHWSTQTAIDQLQLQNARLEIETSSYRATAAELTSEITSLQAAMSSLATRSESGLLGQRAVDRLPETLRVAALGQNRAVSANGTAAPPRRNFDLLSDLLYTLGSRLQVVRDGLARREALAEATPNIWPTDGWLSGTYGFRRDPFTGEREFHPAVDISTRKGRPVYATATGRVVSAGRSGNYGNLIEIDHGFRLITRYSHLSKFIVAAGETVRRGDLIGHVGATGRATGSHVHYEVWANGRTINPLRLLPNTSTLAAN